MKLKPEQLPQHLKQPLATAYWLSGDEPLLVLEAQDLIRQAAHSQGFTDRQVFHSDSTFVPEDLIQATQAMSLFGDRSLIELRITGKFTDPVKKTLAAILENPSQDHVLLISSGKIEATAQKAKWFTALEKQVQLIQFWPIATAQLPQWLAGRARSIGIKLEQDALQFVAEKVDGNLLAAKQELEKLSLSYDGSHSITLDEVISAVADSARWNVFDLSDATSAGKSDRALRILHGLQGEGIEPPIVLWALTKDIRALITIKNQLKQGVPENQVYRSQQIWDKRKPMIQSALNRLDISKLQSLLQQAGQIDRQIKGQESGDVWANLSALVWSFSRQGELF